MNNDDREALVKCRDYAVGHEISVNVMARAVSHAINPIRHDPPTADQAKLVGELEISIRRQLGEALATGRLTRGEIKARILDPPRPSTGKRRAA